ncbi:MATE family efflux transporter [Butyrivibrio sp. CB08]|uniref:MATE family efflux transporter n=1 Tax=Butyrivibrio sp. CB08 TaxID=2364879 RepID=UPI000EA8DC3E|nr:MATE family efflux transporter [Butyrivibrio sp. CB08]RKM61491.1 MATE family efflux transporter [Butyrivibrio sp. CB08]
MEKKNTTKTIKNGSIPATVLKNTIPSMIAMVMVLVYNLADTFFISQTHDALMVAAISLASPIFMIFIAIGNVFGIGATSSISRALGEGNKEKARKISAFSVWGSIITGVLFSALLLIFIDPVLNIIGASEGTWQYTKEYLQIIAIAGPFTILSSCLSNVIRAEGKATTAMIGQLAGNILNIILDPILIIVLGWNVVGAAVATTISSIIGAIYYLSYFKWGKSSLSINPKDFSVKERIAAGVLAMGIPAALGNLLMSVSSILINGQMATYGDMAVAGIGIAMKVTMITGTLFIGFGQGLQPLLGFSVGAKDYNRFKSIMRFSVVLALIMSVAVTLICYIFTDQIVSIFLTDAAAFEYGVSFARIMLSTSFLFGVFYVFSNSIQAMGAASFAMIINISRQGLIYIPALYILHAAFGINGLVMAQPVADVLSFVLVIVLYLKSSRSLMTDSKTNATVDIDFTKNEPIEEC